jgi:hypothetical protein
MATSASIGNHLPATQGEEKREVKKVGILVVLANVGLRELAQNSMLFNGLYYGADFCSCTICSVLV